MRLPVPVARSTFNELLHLMEHGELREAPTTEHLQALLAAADMMCVRRKLVGALRGDRVKRPHEQADLFAV